MGVLIPLLGHCQICVRLNVAGTNTPPWTSLQPMNLYESSVDAIALPREVDSGILKPTALW